MAAQDKPGVNAAEVPGAGSASSDTPTDAGAAKPGSHKIDLASERGRSLSRRFYQDWLKPRWREIAVVLVLTALLAAASGGYPLIIKMSFDVLLKGVPGGLPLVLGAVILVTAARSIFLYLHTIASNRVILELTTDIQKLVFKRIINADMARLSRTTSGELVSRLTNDITFVQNGADAVVNNAIKDIASTVVLVGTMFYLDWVMSLVVLAAYPIAVLPVTKLSSKLRKVARQTQLELGGMTSQLSEKLSGFRLIKTFRLEDYASKRLNESFDEVLRLRLRAVRNRAGIGPLFQAMAGLAVALAIALAYWRITSGTSTVGDFMGFISALLLAAQPIRSVGSIIARAQEGLAAVERIYDVLDEKPQVADAPDAKPLVVSGGAISFEAVSFDYAGLEGEAPTLTNFSLEVPAGSTVALVGRSGAGKTTVINLVPRLFDPTSGRIAIDGQDLRSVTLASLRQSIALVSQDVTLFDDTIRANIALGRLEASNEEIEAAARAAAAHDFIVAQPAGYDTRIGDRGTRLSGGQRQRLALARAILKDAPILLLDEATSALDSQSERLVQDALQAFRRNRTTLVISHRLSTVQDADLICVLEAGQLVEMGRHDDLIARDGYYADLVRAQNRVSALATKRDETI